MALGIFLNFLVALALGALVGLEREYASYKKRGHDFAGIRTFPLISLFGALSAYLGKTISIWLFILGMLLVGILIIMAYFVMNKMDRKHIGTTSELAGFLVFFIGALSFYGEYNLAIILTIAMTTILFARSLLHHFAERIKPNELASTLKFAVVAFVILPFLPNQGYGPLGLFNPYLLWLMVVFISGIGFAGYILMKWFGEKGMVLTGILGGIVSSTAVTTAFSERSKKSKNIYLALVLGVVLANTMMFLVTLVELFVLNRALFWLILPAFLILAVISIIFAYLLFRKVAQTVPGKVELGSPFTIKPALKFGLFFAVILALVKIGYLYFQSQGVYVISFISGFASIDAVTVSLANLAQESLSLMVAKNGIIIAALTNIAVKGGIAWWFGGKEFGRLVLGLFATLIAVGVVLVVLL